MLEELMEKEEERKKSNTEMNLINANTKLMDKLKWIKEDLNSLIYKIKIEAYTKEEIIKEIQKIIQNN